MERLTRFTAAPSLTKLPALFAAALRADGFPTVTTPHVRPTPNGDLMLNLAALLENSARTFPDRTAVVLGVQRMTYAELDAAARRVADLLHARGIGPGDKVALSSPNVLWFPVVYYGILKAGAVVVPLNVLLKDREIAYHLADSRAKAYFCFGEAPNSRSDRRAGPASTRLLAASTSSSCRPPPPRTPRSRVPRR